MVRLRCHLNSELEINKATCGNASMRLAATHAGDCNGSPVLCLLNTATEKTHLADGGKSAGCKLKRHTSPAAARPGPRRCPPATVTQGRPHAQRAAVSGAPNECLVESRTTLSGAPSQRQAARAARNSCTGGTTQTPNAQRRTSDMRID